MAFAAHACVVCFVSGCGTHGMQDGYQSQDKARAGVGSSCCMVKRLCMHPVRFRASFMQDGWQGEEALPSACESVCVCILCAGLPFRASCCWNGIAVLKAAPFKAGVRIRTPIKPDECQVGAVLATPAAVSAVAVSLDVDGTAP